MIHRIRDALGSLTGTLLGVAIMASFALLPVVAVLWIASALGVPWAIDVKIRVLLALAAAVDTATLLLPAPAWFVILTLLWLAFLDVHVRWLVRDELSKHTKATDERTLP